ncbi:hypothetical protein GCM10010873_02820 [Cypionkella aquatica]|uniref:Anti-sigma K factor RskA C-terminal domain-containing protein n=1 Tax=Cypionkella aquatica TaxID=1756042 RepID=A0AA37WZ79_9RHOB|nr:anti-sigma factor [Cypionkella aquatica]GLS85309.1 hypothetical protein GCM10010873_02820 [Cypionkella aquatica]
MNQDLDTRADAYVLGLLDETALADLEQALADDTAWRAAVTRARDRLLPLDMTAAVVPGAARLWDGIAAQLGRQDAAPAPNIPPSLPPQTPQPANLQTAPRRWLQLGLVASVALCIGTVFGGNWFTAEPVVIAVLMDDKGAATAIVEDFGSENARIRFVNAVSVPAGRQMQVWTLPSAEMGPVSLGLLQTASTEGLHPPALPRPIAGQLYEITLEPEGGSPTGRPTGVILAKGLAALQTGT